MNVPPPKESGTPDVFDSSDRPAVDATFPRRPFDFSDVFVGGEGLRAIWGILLFYGILELLPLFVTPLVRSIIPSASIGMGDVQARGVFWFEGVGLLCVIAATWILARMEARPIATYGFLPQHGAANFFAGMGWGVVLLSLLLFSLRAAGLVVFDGRLLFGRGALRYGVIWLAGFLLVGLREELANRGYLQFTLTRGLTALYARVIGERFANALAFWTAALVLSLVFGFGHRANPGESPLGLLSAAVVGLLFCLSLWRTGSLWWAIGFHVSWDWAQSFLYGVADSGLMVNGHLYATHPVGRPILSGGLTGPEGSILLLPVMAAGVAVVLLTLPRTHVGYRPARASEPVLD